MSKEKVMAILEEGAAALEILEDTGFKKVAWRNAARALDDCEGDFGNLLAQGKLTSIKGIGASLAQMLTTIAATGSHPEIAAAKAKLPPGLLDILKVEGVGPKKLQQLWMLHGINSMAQLKAAAESGRLKTFKGFGAKTADKIHASILFIEQQKGKLLITAARALAATLTSAIAGMDESLEIESTGELARNCEVVNAIGLRVIGDEVEGLSEELLGAINPTGDVQFDETTLRFSVDGTPVTIELAARAELATPEFIVRKIVQDSAPTHLARLNKIAQARGLALTPVALKDSAGKELAITSEQDFYQRLGLPFIPPALREDVVEFTLAEKNAVPPSLTFRDLIGCVHNHTTASDGRHTLEQMVAAARALGLHYYGIADHSPLAAYARGLSPDTLLRQTEDIDGLNRRLALEGVKFQVFKGTESDIREDGSLDYEDWVLQRLDYVVASIHSRFNLGREEQTQRIIRAIEHPATCVLGHMTGRLLLERAGYDIDRRAVFEAAAAHRVAIEFNCHPQRLDADWRHLHEVVALGGKVIISADAHSISDLEYLKLGVEVINKAGLSKQDILNCLPADELLAHFKRK